jgi:hypothetical protein
MPETAFGVRIWELPPLILHPFNERIPPTALLENSKAALMISGLMPSDGSDPSELRRRLLAGRYSEIRMLYFLGKDVFRWMEQCVEWAGGHSEFQEMMLRAQSFSALLTRYPPAAVVEKLTRWGVADHSAIFARAVGLNAIFASPPSFQQLSEDFLAHYHRFADSAYGCYLDLEQHASIRATEFNFELYASGEYTRMLESQWAQSEPGR